VVLSSDSSGLASVFCVGVQRANHGVLAVGAPLSYLAASAGFPLHDQAFDAADKALGFDWMTLLTWLNAHTTVLVVFRAIYLSLMLQATLIVLSLAFTGQLAWLRIFVFAFICAAIATIAISCVLPAEGVWSHYGLDANHASYAIPVSHTSWPVFHGLRDGTYRQLMADGAEGIITFPSLHAALAMILCAVSWPNRWLWWLIIPTNFVMLAATPIEGSHYIVDVIAGIAIAGLSVAASLALVEVGGIGVFAKIREKDSEPRGVEPSPWNCARLLTIDRWIGGRHARAMSAIGTRPGALVLSATTERSAGHS
jgi:hypothetical protein